MSPTMSSPREHAELKENEPRAYSDSEVADPAKVIPLFKKGQGTGQARIGDVKAEILSVTSLYGPPVEIPEQPSQVFLMSMRKHFIKAILDALQSVEPYAKTSDAAPYIREILHNIKEMGKNSPLDLFLEILSGIYIALVFDNKWADYEPIQYSNLSETLKKFASRSSLNTNDIEKAIIEIEEIGFDTTPIPIS